MNGQLKTSGTPTTRILSMVLAATACAGSLALHAPQPALAGPGCGDTTVGLRLGVGAQTYLSEEVHQTKDAATTALADLDAWRQDALNSSAKLWQGQTIKDYLVKHGISQDTYLHPAWNHDLERIAIQRSAEANVDFDRTRPNGQDWNSVTTTSGTMSEAEVLASAGMPAAIDRWASEKQTVVDNPAGDNSQSAEHYLFLINPTFKGYGFGTANGNSAVGEASTQAPADQTPLAWEGTCSFEVPTLAKDLTAKVSPSTVADGVQRKPVASATGVWNGWFTKNQTSIFQLRGTYSSDDDSVVDFTSSDTGTTLTAKGVGTANVSMTSGDQNIPLGQVEVVGRTITTVDNPEAVTTASGTRPMLPATVQATWNDGTVTSEPVTWEALPITWRNRAGGRFVLSGTVAAWAKPVKVVVTVTPATAVSAAPVSRATLVGIAPSLPARVQVSWSNGDTTDEPVTWNTIAAQSYAKPGSFSVQGHVAVTGGTQLLASATVTVSTRSASSGFTPASGRIPAGTGLMGEATGDKLADVWGIDRSGTLDFYRSTTTGLVKVGVRGTQLGDLSCLTPIGDQNHDGRADLLYRRTSDGSVWIAYSLGNGYLKQGPRVATNWKALDQIVYAGRMVAGSTTEYVLARRSSDSTLWRYTLNSKGLTNGVLMARRWGNMRTVVSAGNMWGDASWDVVAIANDGTMYGYLTRNGRLSGVGRIGRGWVGMNAVFVPGELTGDGRLDLMAERTNASLWAYRNTGSGWASLGQRGSRFAYRVLG